MSHAANENRTHIYRIRRKRDGMFLNSGFSHRFPEVNEGGSQWGPCGCFWKKEETIRKHLLGLITPSFYCGNGFIHVSTKNKRGFHVVYPYDTPVHVMKPVFAWLDKYEVIATEITVHGESVMEARDFASFLGDKENVA